MDDPEFVAYMKKANIAPVYKNSADIKKALEEMSGQFEKTIIDLKITREQ